MPSTQVQNNLAAGPGQSYIPPMTDPMSEATEQARLGEGGPTTSPGAAALNLVIEAGPLIAFFVAYYMADIMTATAVIIVATILAVGVSWVRTRRVPKMPLITAVIVSVFGGLTLWLQDETFIKMKPTIVYAIFAGVLLAGLATGRALLKPLFQMAFRLTDEGWTRLSLRWALFFIAMAIVNEAVWRTMSTDVWVNFKVFGFLPLTFVFALTQVPFINRHQAPEPQESAE